MVGIWQQKKVTFTLDQEAVSRLAEAAARLSRPKSQAVALVLYEWLRGPRLPQRVAA